jgi:hypothetical protein
MNSVTTERSVTSRLGKYEEGVGGAVYFDYGVFAIVNYPAVVA